MMETNWNAQNNTKLLFSFPPPQQGTLAQISKNIFARNCMKCLELHTDLMFCNLHSMGKGIGPYHRKQYFDENGMRCAGLHECHILQLPTSPQRVWTLGSNIRNNAMSSTKTLVNCPQPFPIGDSCQT